MVYRQIDANTGELMFYGDVSEWWISAADFTRTIQEMQKFTRINIRAHCYGGSVIEGFAIYNAILRSKAEVWVYIDGIAASMFTIIMLAAKRVIISENGFLMIHTPTTVAVGNAKVLQQAVKLLTDMESNFAKIYAKKAGKTEKYVQKWFDGLDHWLSAQDALDEKLVDEVQDPVAENVVTLDTPTPDEDIVIIYNRYVALAQRPATDNPINNLTINNLSMKKELISAYSLTGVSENSTDAEIMAALKAKLGEQEQSAQAMARTAFTAMVEATEAATGRKFDDVQKNHLVMIGEKMGIDSLKAQLALIAPAVAAVPANAAAVADQGQTPPATPQATTIPRVVSMLGSEANTQNASANWTWDEWQEKDPDGLEAKMKTDKDTFRKLYTAKFKVEPDI